MLSDWFRRLGLAGIPLILLGLVTVLPLLVQPAEAQVVRNYQARYTTNDTANFRLIGNMNLYCRSPSGTIGCTGNNNDYSMINLKDDPADGSVANRSLAELRLPAGATVKWAGLYWSARTSGSTPPAGANTVRFRTPQSAASPASGWTLVTSQIALDRFGSNPVAYSAFADVTPLVQAGGGGQYGVANIVAATSATNLYAGWSLVVVFASPTQSFHNMAIFDGWTNVASGISPTIDVSGFLTPAQGAFTTRLGIVAYEGDDTILGDSVQLSPLGATVGATLTDAVNPAGNFFNSTASMLGANSLLRTPAYTNLLGVDQDVPDASGVLANGATGARLRFQSSGDQYFPQVFIFLNDIFQPILDGDNFTKTVDDINGGSVEPGDVLQYKVTLQNAGNDPAVNVVLRDPIPANATYVPGSIAIVEGPQVGPKTDVPGDDLAEFDGSAVVVRGTAVSGATLLPGRRVVMVFRVRVNGGVPANTNIDNQARVDFRSATLGTSSAVFSDGDPATAGAQPTRVTTTATRAEMRIRKSGTPDPVVAGNQITYTIEVSNDGPAPAANVTVTDPVPANTTFVSASAPGGWNLSTPSVGGTGNVVYAISSLPVGTTTLTMVVRVSPTATTTISNTATVATPTDPTPPAPAATSTALAPSGDLQIVKEGPAVAQPGVTVTYTLEVTNTGPGNVTDVRVTDPVPAGTTFVAASAPAGWNVTTAPAVGATGDVEFSNADLPPGSTQLSMQVRVNPGAAVDSTFTNTATLASLPVDSDTTNNASGTTTRVITGVDLEVRKAVDNPLPNIGGTVNFTITIRNLSAATTATGVQVTDLLPAGLTFVSATPSQGTYTAATGIWTVGTLTGTNTPVTNQATLTLRARVDQPGIIANTATLTGSSPSDTNGANNSASAAISAASADIEVGKTANSLTPNVGDTVTFTVTARNNGPLAATGLVVTDSLPLGLRYLSSAPSVGTYNPLTGAWTVGSLANDASATLTITARVTAPGAIGNVATKTSGDQFDPVTANNSAGLQLNSQPVADLAVSKSSSEIVQTVGANVTYTVRIENNGPSIANGVRVADTLPSGVTLLSATPAPPTTYDSNTGVWNVGTLSVDQSLALLLAVRIDYAGALDNFVRATATEADPNPANNTAGITINGTAADKQVVKAVDNTNPSVGELVTFTVTVTNNGPNQDDRVRVLDTLPAGLEYVSHVVTQGSYDPVSGIWFVGSLPVGVGAAQTLTLVARAVAAGPVTNTATTFGGQTDLVPTNDTTSLTIDARTADLALAKTASAATANVGDTVTFALVLSNSGTGPATGIEVTDYPPGGLDYESHVASAGTYNPATGVWSVASLGSGATATLTLTARATAPGVQVNSASVTRADQPDSNPGNDSSSAAVTVPSADLGLTKTVDNLAPNVGATINFTLAVANRGPDAASNVVVTDLLPPGLNFVGASVGGGSCVFDGATRLVTCTIPSIAAAGTATVTITAQVQTAVSLTNTASVRAATYDPVTADNRDAVSLQAQIADLAITKTVDNATPNRNAPVTFTVTASNRGPSAASNVRVLDALPAGLTLRTATPSQGNYDSATGTWNVGSLANGASATLTLAVTVADTGAVTNIARLLGADQFDPNATNDTASASVTPQSADLSVTKSVSDARPLLGDTVSFTVRVANAGPSTATGVRLADLLPAGLTLGTATPSQGTYSSATGLWTVGTLAANATATLTLAAQVAQPGSHTNTASGLSADQPDPNSTNNSAGVSLFGQAANLIVGKSVSNAQPSVGDTITYTVTANNLGPSAAPNVIVNDPLPAGLTLVSVTPSQGSYSSGIWNVGDLLDQGIATLTIRAVVDVAGAITNTATVDSDLPDPVPGDNSASVTTFAPRSNLSLAKTASSTTPTLGDTVTFTLALSNAGPNAASGVVVRELLPAGLRYESHTTTSGTYDPATGRWTVGGLANGDTATLNIVARVDTVQPVTNTTEVAAMSETDPDSTPNNNNPAENDQASVTLVPQAADLSIAKRASSPNPSVGDTVTFTLTVRNAGPSTAANVVVNDLIPAGFQYLSHVSSQGGYVPTSGVWTVGSILADGVAELAITVRVLTTSPVTNTATVASDLPDPGSGDNSASVTIPQQVADLTLSKTVDDPVPTLGAEVTFTLRLSNAGPNAATNVQVRDLLPAGLQFVQATPSQGGYDASSGVWQVGSVAVGATPTLALTAIVVADSPVTNEAEIRAADQFDPNSTPNNGEPNENDQATVTVSPRSADLAIAKAVNIPNPNRGDEITFTLTASNAGPSAADDVRVLDALPTGLLFQSATSSQGNYDSTSGLWSVGSLGTGASATLTINAIFDTATSVTNTATVFSELPDPGRGDNSASVTVPQQIADLALAKTVDNPQPNLNSVVTFTITVSNRGPNSATGVRVKDRLGAGLTFQSVTPSQGAYDAPSGIWQVGTVTSGNSAQLVIQALVTSAGTVLNTAEVIASDQFDPTSTPNNNNSNEDDQASITLNAQAADLAVTKTGPVTVTPGQTIAFAIQVSNAGPGPALDVVLADTVPAGLTLQSVTAPCAGGFPCNLGVVNLGAVVTITATYLVDANFAGNSIVNRVAVSSSTTDPNPFDNNTSATVTVLAPQADLAIVKTGPTAVTLGSDAVFALVLTNNGPDAAANVVLDDPAPAGLTLVGVSGGGCSTLPCTLANLAAGESVTITVIFRVPSDYAGPSAITNVASVASATGDPNSNNDVATVVVGVSGVQISALSLTKTDAPDPVAAGGNLVYTLTLTNIGNANATNVVLADPVPANTTFVSATAGGTLEGGVVRWNLGTLAPGASRTVALTVLVANGLSGGTVIANAASVTSNESPTPVSAQASTTVTSTPGLALTKTSAPNPVVAGGNLVYTLAVTNGGNGNATSAVLADPVPASTTFVSATAGGTLEGGVVRWNLGTLAAGASRSVSFTVRVDADLQEGVVITNTATLTADQTSAISAQTSTRISAVVDIPALSQTTWLALLALLLLMGWGSLGQTEQLRKSRK